MNSWSVSGLDYDEYYRNLDSIAVLKPSVYEGGQA